MQAMEYLCREGTALYFREAGSGRPPLVFIHDTGEDHTSFADQFEAFRRSRRVVAVDLRGHGRSGRAGTVLVPVLAGDLAWLCAELGLYRPVLIGRGLGARAAVELTVRYPTLAAGIISLVRPAARFTESEDGHLNQRGGVRMLTVNIAGCLPAEINDAIERCLSRLEDTTEWSTQ